VNEQDALLESIFAEPADDTPRLVYADWLDEHGEGEYAAFIRLQIERARMKKKTPKRDRLLKEENAVWRKLKKRWADLFAGWAIRKDWFDRGFCFGTAEGWPALEIDTFIAQSPLWWPRLPVRSVRLWTTNPSPDALLDSDHLSRLTRLEFHRSTHEHTFREEFTVQFFASKRFTRLVELHLGHVALSRATAKAMRSAPFLNNLKKLSVSYYSLRHSGSLLMPDYNTYLAKNPDVKPGSVAAALRERLKELIPNYLVVPPGETSWRAILAANGAT